MHLDNWHLNWLLVYLDSCLSYFLSLSICYLYFCSYFYVHSFSCPWLFELYVLYDSIFCPLFHVLIQSLSHVQLLETSWTTGHHASMSFTISQSLVKFMSIESVMLSNHLFLCHPFLLLPQSFPASGSFSMSQLFALCGRTIGASALAWIPQMNIQGWFPLGWTSLIFLMSKGLSSLL